MGISFKPLFDKVLLKVVNNDQVVNGLYIPDTSTNLKKGIVVAAGADSVVKEGKTVLFTKDVGTLITLEGEQYLVVSEREVWMTEVSP